MTRPLNGISRTRAHRLLALLVGLAFIVTGVAWSVASPIGSAADDGFHLGSIWCAWGPSDSCQEGEWNDEVQSRFRAPAIIQRACYVWENESSAACINDVHDTLVPTLASVDGTRYPLGFHAVMRAFVGPDAQGSVVHMRIFNVLIAGVLLTLALALARPQVALAISLSWLVCIAPVGLFFIASTNPSGWSITGAGLFWAFFLTFMTAKTWKSRSGVAAGLGSLLTFGLAAGSRSDAALFVLIAGTAVCIYTWPNVRRHLRRLLVLATPFVLVALVSLSVRLRAMGMLSGATDPSAGPTAATDTAAAASASSTQSIGFFLGELVRYGGELPAMWAGMLGNGYPQFNQAVGFTYGLGYLDLWMPSLVGVFALLNFGGLIFRGIDDLSARKTVSLIVIGVFLVAVPLATLARFDFTNVVQPRYILPLLLVFTGFLLLPGNRSRMPVSKAHVVWFAATVTCIQGASLLAVIRRHTNGQSQTWLSVFFEPEWWWGNAPSPTIVWAIGTAAGALLAGLLGTLAYQSGKAATPTISH